MNQELKTMISAKELLERIEMYRIKLVNSKTISETKYKNMITTLYGVKMIIGDLVIDEKKI